MSSDILEHRRKHPGQVKSFLKRTARLALVSISVIVAMASPAVLSKPERLTIGNTASVIKKARANVKNLTKNDVEGLRQFASILHGKKLDREELQLRLIICDTKFACATDYCELGDMYSDIMADSDIAVSAQKCYEQALKVDPECSKAYGELAELALIRNQKEKALSYSTRGLACKHRDSLTFKTHANVLSTMKRYKEALAILTQAEKEVEMSAEMYRVKGSVLENLNRLDEAVVSYRKSLLSGYSDWASFQIVRCLEAQMRYPAAIAELDKIVQHNAKDGEAYRHRAKVKVHIKDYQGALKDLNSAIDLEPTTKSFRERAVVYELMGRKDLARKDVQEANRIMNEPF